MTQSVETSVCRSADGITILDRIRRAESHTDAYLPSSSTAPTAQSSSLLVASSGGHIEELARLRDRVVPAVGDVEWVTFDSPQTRRLLDGEVVHYVPRIHPKDIRGTWLGHQASTHLLKRGSGFARVISTGAAIAVPFLRRARQLQLGAHYIESAARTESPSLTGGLVSWVPGVRLYGQHRAWTAGRWQYRGSVFDGYRPGPDAPRTEALDKVVVTLGTQAGFDFHRAVRRIAKLLPEVTTGSPTVLWQTGGTEVTHLGLEGRWSVPPDELKQAISEADLVIGHAGVGTALLTLASGRAPLLLPRLRNYGEHTDDHQLQVAEELRRRHLARAAMVDLLSAEDLTAASEMTVAPALQPAPFVLQPD